MGTWAVSAVIGRNSRRHNLGIRQTARVGPDVAPAQIQHFSSAASGTLLPARDTHSVIALPASEEKRNSAPKSRPPEGGAALTNSRRKCACPWSVRAGPWASRAPRVQRFSRAPLSAALFVVTSTGHGPPQCRWRQPSTVHPNGSGRFGSPRQGQIEPKSSSQKEPEDLPDTWRGRPALPQTPWLRRHRTARNENRFRHRPRRRHEHRPSMRQFCIRRVRLGGRRIERRIQPVP